MIKMMKKAFMIYIELLKFLPVNDSSSENAKVHVKIWMWIMWLSQNTRHEDEKGHSNSVRKLSVQKDDDTH